MLFDSKMMQPLYQLQIGKPGSSFAFEIARKIGFPNYVLNRAKKKSGSKHIRFDQQLQQLETDKIQLKKKQEKVESVDDELSKTVEKYTNLLSELNSSRKQIISDAKADALRIIENSNRAVEKTIREIKEADAEKNKTQIIRQELEGFKEVLKNEAMPKSVSKKASSKKPKQKNQTVVEKPIKNKKIAIGDYVMVIDTDIVGELISISGEDVIVNVNNVKLKTSLAKLIITNAPIQKATPYKSSHSGIISEINKKATNFKLSLDLRGKRVDEALAELQKYIDEAILLSIKEVSILHGKGNGILRPIIREYLQSVVEIKHYGDASLDQGGAGITRVTLE